MQGDPFVGSDKLLRFPERLGEWMRTGRTSGPIVADFYLTNRCPHNCPACPGEWRNDPSAEMSFEDARRWLLEFAAIGTKAVSFSGGGDPLAHPRAVELMDVARRAGMSVGVITNAACLSESKASDLTEIATWVRVSLDAATGETFAKVHGVPEKHFGTILDNIRLLTDASEDCIIGVGFLTSATLADEIVPAAKLARELGADYIQYRPYNYDMYDPTEEITEAKVGYETDDFKVLASWPKYREMSEGYVKPYERCMVHHFSAVVTAHGNMVICCDHKTEDGFCGSLKEFPLSYLWNSGIRDQVVSRIDLSRCPPLCRGNTHNILLDVLGKNVTHEEFL